MEKLLPTGECWCGCGKETTVGAFFSTGHDKIAESAVLKIVYGNVPNFLVEHGYGPDGKNPSKALDEYRRNGGEYL
jgi:hypothetical protein